MTRYYRRAVLYIVTDSRRTYHGIVERLTSSAGAELVELDPRDSSYVLPGIRSKARMLRQLVSPELLRLRKRWGHEDVVLTLGWYVLPILALIRLRALPRPRKIISLYAFVRSGSMRRAVNLVLRWLMIPELEFIQLTPGEARNLVENVGAPPEQVHQVIWRTNSLDPEVEVAEGDPPYVFTGGFSNRDYDTFLAAVEQLPYRVLMIASDLNRLQASARDVELRIDVPSAEFERFVAACHVLVLPLYPAAEASGAGVLHRGMRYLRPVVATRHDSLIAHLGEDYAGFVPARDPEALRRAIARAMGDESFRRALIDQISQRRDLLRRRGDVAQEILGIVQSKPR